MGLTYELRFVCEREECELEIRPPVVKSRPFSNRKAIKYYNMTAEQNSVEGFASLGRLLNQRIMKDKRRAAKDYVMKCSHRYPACQIRITTVNITES